MTVNFHKFHNKVNIDLDLEQILSQITKEFSNEQNTYHVFETDTTEPYWQIYPYTGTIFSRNFSSNFTKESKQIIEQFEVLRSSVCETDFANKTMYEIFCNHQFDYRKVQLIKTAAGENVKPHIDNGRKFVLNVGLRNSNTCTTYLAATSDKTNFWSDNPSSFVMQDNEVYMVNVDAAHAVRSMVSADSGLDRYLITYKIT